jgi:CubicO group peptidase (beta-lactamase class C family)
MAAGQNRKNATDYSAFVRSLQDSIAELMEKHDIPGLAIALVEGPSLVWAEGFGHTDRTKMHPVTVNTPFSLQSTGKTYTATGFLRAASKGLVGLDEPLRSVYPAFTVHSRFGKDQVDKIAFRHLLSHWSGLCHEAPLGNNYDDRPCTFEEHVQSISDTWLKFPVGQRWSYSNLGMDLVGYALQLISNRSFVDYMADELLEPLGMTRSSFDQAYVMDRFAVARGHTGKYEAPPQLIPMLAAGSIFASVRDMARFVSFHLTGCVVDGRRLIDEALLKEMIRLPFPVEKQVCGYGLGILIRPRFGATLLSHPGGGYGYQGEQCWIPEYNIGAAIVTNQANHPSVQFEIRDAALRGMIAAQLGSIPEDQPLPFANWPAIDLELDQLRRLEGVYRSGDDAVPLTVKAGTLTGGEAYALRPYEATGFTNADGVRVTFQVGERGRPQEMQVLDQWGYTHWLIDHAPGDPPGPDKEAWRELAGIYSAVEYGNMRFVAVTVKTGYLHLVGWMGDARLAEYTPGTFFTADGEAVIFGDGTMTYGNAPLVRQIDPDRRAFELAETDRDHRRLRQGALIGLGRAYLALQDRARAINILSLNARLYPDSMVALRYLAEAYLDGGDEAGAEQCCQQILEMDPGNQAALSMLATMDESGAVGHESRTVTP